MCDFHSVNVCRVQGLAGARACSKGKVSAGAGAKGWAQEGQAEPGGWDRRQLVPGRKDPV